METITPSGGSKFLRQRKAVPSSDDCKLDKPRNTRAAAKKTKPRHGENIISSVGSAKIRTREVSDKQGVTAADEDLSLQAGICSGSPKCKCFMCCCSIIKNMNAEDPYVRWIESTDREPNTKAVKQYRFSSKKFKPKHVGRVLGQTKRIEEYQPQETVKICYNIIPDQSTKYVDQNPHHQANISVIVPQTTRYSDSITHHPSATSSTAMKPTSDATIVFSNKSVERPPLHLGSGLPNDVSFPKNFHNEEPHIVTTFSHMVHKDHMLNARAPSERITMPHVDQSPLGLKFKKMQRVVSSKQSQQDAAFLSNMGADYNKLNYVSSKNKVRHGTIPSQAEPEYNNYNNLQYVVDSKQVRNGTIPSQVEPGYNNLQHVVGSKQVHHGTIPSQIGTEFDNPQHVGSRQMRQGTSSSQVGTEYNNLQHVVDSRQMRQGTTRSHVGTEYKKLQRVVTSKHRHQDITPSHELTERHRRDAHTNMNMNKTVSPKQSSVITRRPSSESIGFQYPKLDRVEEPFQHNTPNHVPVEHRMKPSVDVQNTSNPNSGFKALKKSIDGGSLLSSSNIDQNNNHAKHGDRGDVGVAYDHDDLPKITCVKSLACAEILCLKDYYSLMQDGNENTRNKAVPKVPIHGQSNERTAKVTNQAPKIRIPDFPTKVFGDQPRQVINEPKHFVDGRRNASPRLEFKDNINSAKHPQQTPESVNSGLTYSVSRKRNKELLEAQGGEGKSQKRTRLDSYESRSSPCGTVCDHAQQQKEVEKIDTEEIIVVDNGAEGFTVKKAERKKKLSRSSVTPSSDLLDSPSSNSQHKNETDGWVDETVFDDTKRELLLQEEADLLARLSEVRKQLKQDQLIRDNIRDYETRNRRIEKNASEEITFNKTENNKTDLVCVNSERSKVRVRQRQNCGNRVTNTASSNKESLRGETKLDYHIQRIYKKVVEENVCDENSQELSKDNDLHLYEYEVNAPERSPNLDMTIACSRSSPHLDMNSTHFNPNLGMTIVQSNPDLDMTLTQFSPNYDMTNSPNLDITTFQSSHYLDMTNTHSSPDLDMSSSPNLDMITIHSNPCLDMVSTHSRSSPILGITSLHSSPNLDMSAAHLIPSLDMATAHSDMEMTTIHSSPNLAITTPPGFNSIVDSPATSSYSLHSEYGDIDQFAKITQVSSPLNTSAQNCEGAQVKENPLHDLFHSRDYTSDYEEKNSPTPSVRDSWDKNYEALSHNPNSLFGGEFNFENSKHACVNSTHTVTDREASRKRIKQFRSMSLFCSVNGCHDKCTQTSSSVLSSKDLTSLKGFLKRKNQTREVYLKGSGKCSRCHIKCDNVVLMPQKRNVSRLSTERICKKRSSSTCLSGNTCNNA